mgnify:CR=1 FL=1
MEKTMLYPVSYNVLSMDEMTYTSGGATATQAILAALLPPYGWYKASTEIRDYRKKNPNTWLDTGLDAFVAGCEKSVTNAIYGIGCAYNFVAMNIATSGIGLIPGAMLGGILLGIIEIFGKAYISSQMADAIVFAVLIVVLLVRPAGLFGKNIQEKV